MRLRRFVLPAVAALGCSLLLPATAAHATDPWPTGTVFVAESGQRTANGGAWAVAPDGTKTLLGSGSAEDIAVEPDGTVYWVECSGGLYRYIPGGGAPVMVANPGNCPTGVLLGPDGIVAVANFDGVSLYDSNANTLTPVPDSPTGMSSLTDDGDGDVYFASGSQQFSIWPEGGKPVAVQGYFGGDSISSVRMDDSFNILAAAPNSHKVWQESADAATSSSWDTTYYVDGAVADGDHNLFASTLIDDPSTADAITEQRASDSAVLPLAVGFDTPKGLATWPPAVPGTRSATTTTLSVTPAIGATTVSTEKLTATVTGAPGDNAGVVQFSSDGQSLGPVQPISGGLAVLSAKLPQGDHQILATYLGTSTARPSQSDATPLTVSPLRTSTMIGLANTSVPQAYGLDVSAHVGPLRTGFDAPTGSVSFYVNGSFVGEYPLDSSGNATATDRPIKAGANAVKAVYEGDALYGTSANQVTVNGVPPYGVDINDQEVYGAVHPNGSERVTIHLTLTGQPHQPTPTGTITAQGRRFTCGSTTVLVGRLVATCVGNAPPGFSLVTFVYSGDSLYIGPLQFGVDVSVFSDGHSAGAG